MKLKIDNYILPCFTNENEKYLTIPVLLNLCEELEINKHYTLRSDLLDNIADFMSISKYNQVAVYDYLENTLKEGIKHIYIKEINEVASKHILDILKSPSQIEALLQEKFNECPQGYLSSAFTTDDFQLLSYNYEIKGETVSKINMVYVKDLLSKDNTGLTSKIVYPIFAEIDLKNNLILLRLKSKSKIYPYNKALHIPDGLTPLCITSLLENILTKVTNAFNLYVESWQRSSFTFRKRIFNILDYFTFTPQYIQELITSYSAQTQGMAQNIISTFNISPATLEKIKGDINVMIEKYLSVETLTTDILSSDRDAYPIKIASTDSELTRFSTTASEREALQCKERFFDTKRALQYEKTCDTVSLCYNRIKKKHFSSEPFVVTIDFSKKWCGIKFTEYVREEEIQHVLSRIITD